MSTSTIVADRSLFSTLLADYMDNDEACRLLDAAEEKFGRLIKARAKYNTARSYVDVLSVEFKRTLDLLRQSEGSPEV